MARIPWRIFISRSIRRSSLLLNKPMATSWWAMPTLLCVKRGVAWVSVLAYPCSKDAGTARVLAHATPTASLVSVLHVFLRRFPPRGLVGFFVSLILLHHAAVHVVPDIHDLRPRLFQPGSRQCIAIRLLAKFKNLIQPLAVHFLRYGIILDPLADSRHIFFGDIQPPQRPAFFSVFLHHAQSADRHQLLAAQIQLAGDHQLLLRLHLKLKGERFAQL